MRFDIKALSEGDRQDISGWRYAAPYDIYDMHSPIPSERPVRGLYEKESGALAGFFCWGTDAQVMPAGDIYAAQDALDFGIAMKQEYTGKHLGLFACNAALDWLRSTFMPTQFRLAVYSFNSRAQRIYARLGFTLQAMRGNFFIMAKDERPWREATRPLENGMPVYPADPGFDRHLHYHKEDCGWDMSVFAMSAHTGTHIDAPAHIGLLGGVETLDLKRMQGAVQVLQWPAPAEAMHITKLLLKTGGRGLTLQEAQALLAHGIQTIGLDGMSVGEGDEEMAVHRLFLTAGVLIIENIALEDFAPGWYQMRCLPLLMPGSDGVPVRLQLREELP